MNLIINIKKKYIYGKLKGKLLLHKTKIWHMTYQTHSYL